MKSYKIIENGKPIEQVEIEKPIPVGDEILVKTVSCGVCHSDVHIYEGFFDLGGGAKLPTPVWVVLHLHLNQRNLHRYEHLNDRPHMKLF